MEIDMKFKFVGHLADTATNIRHGKDGAKILIEVPQSEISKIADLIFMQGIPLSISLEPATDDEIDDVKETK